MPKPNCRNIGGKIVCGQLHSGGSVPKKGGLFRLAKGEKVFSKTALNKMGKTKKTATHRKRKKCKCKH